MDRIDQFRIFARVVEAGNFTRAAATLNLPRSTVSTAVSLLEERLGTRLLSRTTRKVAPTQDGLTFYERCIQLISDVEEAEAAFRPTSASLTGKLHVDLPGRIGRLIVIPALPSFLSRHPGLDLQLGVTDRAVNLVSENVDCALRIGTLEDSELIARHVGKLSVINVASPAYLERCGTPQNLEELHKNHRAIAYASPTTGRAETWDWHDGNAIHTLDIPSAITVNSAEAYIAAALAGLGIIQVPAYDVRDRLRNGDLIEILPAHRSPDLPMSLLYPHRRHLSQRVQVFADWLVDLIQTEIEPRQKHDRNR